MNPRLDHLQPYPFERLRALFAGVDPPACAPIRLSIGEPQHATPKLVEAALLDSLAGLSNYPATLGAAPLREAIAAWLARRFDLPPPDPACQILPVNGTREALFALAQCVVDPAAQGLVACPNPFYQIYEGATLLAGAQPAFINQVASDDYRYDCAQLDQAHWARVQLAYVCSPGNPSGKVLSLDEWAALFELSDRHGFVVAADECYSEIYFDEARPPLGALAAARRLGRDDYRRLVVLHSLSKRSNVPGLRSGFVAGDAALLERFLLYRTYHGCAMGLPVQAASRAAWADEAHVRDNRRLYAEKFERVTPLLTGALEVRRPQAGFYLWARTPIADTEFARRLYAATHVTVLPGSFLARPAMGINPGAHHVRIALVAGLDECLEAAHRIQDFCRTL